MRNLGFIIIVGFLSGQLMAQKSSKLKESYVDSVSYVYFTKGKHQELVNLTKKALNDGIDSYYLRVRIGVSYFNKNEFYSATIHLRKALVFYPSDMYAKEFLFYSYLYMENFEEAKLVISKMPLAYQEGYRKLIKFQKSFVFESGYQMTSYSNKQDSTTFLAKDAIDTSIHGNGVYAQSDRMKSILYYQVGLGYPISKRIKGYSGLSLVQNNRESHVYSKGYVWDNTNFVFTSFIKDTAHSYTLSQYQVYSGLTITLPKHFTLLAGGQYLYYAQNKLYATYLPSTNSYKYKDSNTFRSNFVSNVSLTKSFGKFIPMLSMGVNSIDGNSIIQYSAQTTYLPFGNFNLHLTGGFSVSKDNTDSRNVFFFKVGGKITPNLWYDAYCYTGNLKNYSEGNGYVVYNISDKITMKTGWNLTYYLSQKINFGLRYDLLKRESSYLRYYNTTTYKSYNDNYLNHSLIFNLLWKF